MNPDLTIRSTFIAGFPGETEAEFEYLLDFLWGDAVSCELGVVLIVEKQVGDVNHPSVRIGYAPA